MQTRIIRNKGFYMSRFTAPSAGLLASTAVGFFVALGAKPALAQASTSNAGGDDAETLPTLNVQGTQGSGYNITTPSLGKLTSSLVNTPQTMIEVSKQLLQDQNATTMRDALRNVPGVSLAAGEGGQQGDNLSIRGFNAQDDFYLDGMLDFGSYYRDPFNLEQLEVLEGPNSVLFGRGSTGGVVNQVSKQPQLTPVSEAEVSLGTDGLYRVTADLGRPIEGVPNAAFRLNVMANTNGVPGRDAAHNRRLGVAPELAFGIGTPTRLTIDYYHLQSNDTPDYGIPWINGSPAPVAHDTFYGYPDKDYFRTNVNIATIKFEHDFSDNFTVTNQFRYGNYQRALRVVEPQILAQGAGTDVLNPSIPLSSVVVSRSAISLKSTETLLDDQFYGTWSFGSGFVHNTLVGGAEVSRQGSDPTRYSYTKTTTSLFNPAPIPFTLSPLTTTVTKTVVNDVAPFAVDTLSLGRYVDLIGGWRWDSYSSKFRAISPTVSTIDRDDDLPSWRGAIVVKPTDNGSIYFDYGTSFDPSAEGLSLSVATASVAPESTTIYELGTKWNLLHNALSLTGSVYQLEMANVRESNPADPTTDILAGNYRIRGYQVSISGNVTPRWNVFGGFDYNDGIVVSSPNKLEVGHAPANAPKDMLSVFTTYQLPMPAGLHDLQIGGGANWVSSRAASSAPLAGATFIERAPGYVTAQLMAKYPINKHLNAQVNIQNVTNTYYYDELHPYHVILGPSRSATFELAASF